MGHATVNQQGWPKNSDATVMNNWRDHCKVTQTGTVAPERIWKWGGTGLEWKWGEEKFVFGRAPPLFGSKSTISRFGERFRGGQYSLVSFLFAVFLLVVPPCPAICKSGGHVPHGVTCHWTGTASITTSTMVQKQFAFRPIDAICMMCGSAFARRLIITAFACFLLHGSFTELWSDTLATWTIEQLVGAGEATIGKGRAMKRDDS